MVDVASRIRQVVSAAQAGSAATAAALNPSLLTNSRRLQIDDFIIFSLVQFLPLLAGLFDLRCVTGSVPHRHAIAEVQRFARLEGKPIFQHRPANRADFDHSWFFKEINDRLGGHFQQRHQSETPPSQSNGFMVR